MWEFLILCLFSIVMIPASQVVLMVIDKIKAISLDVSLSPTGQNIIWAYNSVIDIIDKLIS